MFVTQLIRPTPLYDIQKISYGCSQGTVFSSEESAVKFHMTMSKN